MSSNYRIKMIEGTIKKQLSVIIEDFLRDKDFPITSITQVLVDKGIQLAKIQVSVLGKRKRLDGIIEYLNNNKKKIRFLLAKKIRLKFMPDIKFFSDNSYEIIEKINNLRENGELK